MRFRSFVAILGGALGVAWAAPTEASVGAVNPEALPESLRLPATDEGLPGVGPIRRADWFVPIWNERRALFAANASALRGAWVFLGDSITQGWGEDFSATFPGFRIANRGIGGDTSRGVLIRLEADVMALRPRGVVLLVGTNDIEEGAPASATASNVGLIIARLREAVPDLPVILCEVFPSSPTKARPRETIMAVNADLAELVAKDPHTRLLRTWAVFADREGNAPVAEFPDLLHPNLAGYARWAAMLRPALAEAEAALAKR